MKALLARHRPESPVCFGAAGARDAAQFAAYARAIAALLPSAPERLEATPPAGYSVVLACTDRYRFSAALVGIWLRGYTAVLPANGQAATVHEAASASGVLALLHDREQGVGIDVRTVEQESARGELPLELELTDHAAAIIAYTSGSTGQPTPHRKTLTQLLSEPEAHLCGFALTECRILAAVPPYHIYGLLFGVLVPLLGGGSMSRSAPLQPAELLHELHSAQADVLIAVPPQLAAVAAYQTDAWPALRHVFSSAAPLPAATSAALAAHGWRVTEILGSTETGGIAQRSDPQASWQPLPGVQITIADDAALCVDSPWLAPAAARPVRTADRVEPAGDGGFRHLGRSDAVVKIGGRRIDLGELEARLKQASGVRDARVLAVESAGVRGLELLAVVESDSAQPLALRRELSARVDPVAVPRRFRIVKQLPRSETGKVTRSDLLALFDVWSFPCEALSDGRVRVVVPHDSGFFRGHFDGQPILPGVVQLQHLALAETRRRFPALRVLTRVSRVKFKRLVEPGETLVLALTPKGPLTVAFEIEANGHPSASGILHFREERA
ncbi:MAG: hypothetical protein JWN48_3228 [Myxococcaceae bacterium]|nr:hypothetical protein [Myxococcaceae bacterium]